MSDANATIFSAIMGFIGGLFVIPINAIVSHILKRDELKYANKLDVIAKQRELLLEHKLAMQAKGKEQDIVDLKKRVALLERRTNNE